MTDVEQGTNTLAVDSQGSVYLAGLTASLDFPATPGSAQPTFGGGTADAFVMKLSSVLPPAPPIVKHVVLLVIDGLRTDVLDTALNDDGGCPNLRALFVGNAGTEQKHVTINTAYTVFPSITFTANASLVTAKYPDVHGIPGNRWFKRAQFPTVPRTYATDVRAARNYSFDPLTNEDLSRSSQTIYDYFLAVPNMTAKSVFHMYVGNTHDSSVWIRPSFDDMLLWSPLADRVDIYDNNMMHSAISELIANGTPHLLTLYFAGVDHYGHSAGVGYQLSYLQRYIDPLLRGFTTDTVHHHINHVPPDLEYAVDEKSFPAEYKTERWEKTLKDTVFVLVADHGQSQVLRAHAGESLCDLGVPPTGCTSTVTEHGGMAHVYIRASAGRTPDGAVIWDTWDAQPTLVGDMLPSLREYFKKKAKWNIGHVLVRVGGWNSNYLEYLGEEGLKIILKEPELNQDPVLNNIQLEALNRLDSKEAGDIVLIAEDGFSFEQKDGADHGNINMQDSAIPLMFAGQPFANTIMVNDKHFRIVDVAPTILKMLGLGEMTGVDGKAITQVIEALKK
ncbi:MAG: putative superfamily protein [Acidobacteria bacterium]|nr:putative superfamily protein [Acidobacteriota bacterium]